MNIKKFFSRKKNSNNFGSAKFSENSFKKSKSPKSLKKLWIIFGVVVVLFLIAFFVFEHQVKKVIPGGGNLLTSIVKIATPDEDLLEGEKDGRINIALLGMRGEGVVGGGTLADTIMVASLKIDKDPNNEASKPTYKVSMISVPRDLYVIIPGTNNSAKINAVYAYGEQQEHGGGGIKYMKQILEDVTGQKIHYAAAINFEGFKQVVDALGGVEVTLDEPFEEAIQFHEAKVCDGDKGGVFTVKTGTFEYKKDKKGKVVAQYPLCYNKNEECNGDFKVPAGTSTLDGATALCYVRARYTSSDFDRVRRQQEVIKQLEKKALKAGYLADFDKINGVISAVGNNVSIQMDLWEMKRFFDIYKEAGDNVPIKQKVLENSEEGLLYSHEGDERGYILMPRGDSYDGIREMFANIFND